MNQKLFFYFAFASFVLFFSMPILAQKTSTSARVQQLAKLEEDLSSSDPNTRLAALEGAMESSSIAYRERALTLGLISRDNSLRSVALRYAFCGRTTLNLLHGISGKNPSAAKYYARQAIGIYIKNCNPSSGQFEAVWTSLNGPQKSVITQGIISGQSVEFSVAHTNGNNVIYNNCIVNLRLQNDAALAGQLSCSLMNFGPVAATIALR